MSKSKMEGVSSAAKRLGEWLETHKGRLEGADPKETAHRVATLGRAYLGVGDGRRRTGELDRVIDEVREATGWARQTAVTLVLFFEDNENVGPPQFLADWMRARLRCEYEAAIANAEADAERTAEELKQMLIELDARDQERKADQREKTVARSTAGHASTVA
ncbi:MAG: hypothetical protein OXI15_20090 [Chromatiales bacterium]|nr:hypothetical protein [Chromatiales bacterium]